MRNGKSSKGWKDTYDSQTSFPSPVHSFAQVLCYLLFSDAWWTISSQRLHVQVSLELTSAPFKGALLPSHHGALTLWAWDLEPPQPLYLNSPMPFLALNCLHYKAQLMSISCSFLHISSVQKCLICFISCPHKIKFLSPHPSPSYLQNTRPSETPDRSQQPPYFVYVPLTWNAIPHSVLRLIQTLPIFLVLNRHFTEK